MAKRGLNGDRDWTGSASIFARNHLRALTGSEELLPEGAAFPPLDQTPWAHGFPQRTQKKGPVRQFLAAVFGS